MRFLLLVPLALSVAACGGVSEGSSDPASSPGAAERTLVVEFSAGDGTPTERFSLVCGDEARGEHPEPAAACARVLRMDDPFAPPPTDLICTEQYGGPETARITGTWEGEEVDVELSRVDGCAIERWDAFVPVVPEPVGVQPIG